MARPVRKISKPELLKVARRVGYNRGSAAIELGVSTVTLRKWIRDHEVTPEEWPPYDRHKHPPPPGGKGVRSALPVTEPTPRQLMLRF